MEKNIEEIPEHSNYRTLGSLPFLSWRLLGQMRDQNAPQPQLTLQGMSPKELQLLRHDFRKQKQKLIGENLPMTESEALKFWAVTRNILTS
jgi:hypothetical protein